MHIRNVTLHVAGTGVEARAHRIYHGAGQCLSAHPRQRRSGLLCHIEAVSKQHRRGSHEILTRQVEGIEKS